MMEFDGKWGGFFVLRREERGGARFATVVNDADSKP
jgi:hypothetical protein